MSRRKQGIVPKKSDGDREDQEPEVPHRQSNGDTSDLEQGERVSAAVTVLIVTVFNFF